jgi:hypothetical protein
VVVTCPNGHILVKIFSSLFLPESFRKEDGSRKRGLSCSMKYYSSLVIFLFFPYEIASIVVVKERIKLFVRI